MTTILNNLKILSAQKIIKTEINFSSCLKHFFFQNIVYINKYYVYEYLSIEYNTLRNNVFNRII